MKKQFFILFALGIAGLLACMPVPVGDPERSRIDPNLSGAWLLAEENDLTMGSPSITFSNIVRKDDIISQVPVSGAQIKTTRPSR